MLMRDQATVIFDEMDDTDLLIEVRKRFSVAAQAYVDLAMVVGPAFRRGLDLSFIPDKILDVLRKIESKQILPDLAEKYLHLPVFNRLKNLPLDDQQKIVDTGKIEIAVRRGDSFDTRKLPVDALTTDQQRLAFESGRIRSNAEQIAILEDRPEPEEDPYNESIVCFKFPSVSIDLKKSESKALKEKAERAGGMTELLKHAIKRML